MEGQFAPFLGRSFAILSTTKRLIDLNQQTRRLIIVRSDFRSAFEKFGRLLELALRKACSRIEVMRFKRIRIEGDGLFELRLRFFVALASREGHSSRGVRFRQLVV